MSANVNNASLELIHEAPRLEPRVPTRVPAPVVAPGHEALQSLLAFSSLHQQILERRRLEAHGRTQDAWGLDQFMLAEVLQLVAEKALAITGADGIAIALAENDAIVCRASAGGVAPDVGASVHPNSGFSGACLISGSTVRCDDAENDARIDVLACRRLGARSMLAVPLSAKQTVVGLIEAFSSEPYGFNDSDVRSLNLLAGLILAAIRPEEENRLAEISRRVVERAAIEPAKPRIAAEAMEPMLAPSRGEDESEKEIHGPIEPASVEPAALEPASVEPAALFAEYATVERSRPGITVVVGVVCLAIVLGGGLWRMIRRNSHAANAKVRPTAVGATTQPVARSVAAVPAATAPSSASSEEASGLAADDSSSNAESSSKSGAMATVTGIRHWTTGDSSTVVIDLQDQVQYEAHRLTDPERIYFDLHDTKLGLGVSNKPIEVQDELLQRIRVAQPVAGVTRVVLETKGASNFSVSLEANPYRLVVEIRKLGAKPDDRAKIDLFAPMGQPASAPNAAALQPAAVPSANTTAGAPKAKLVSPPTLRIALDAGHGGWDLGTVGRKGLLEKDLVLDIVERLGKLIEQRLGAAVIYTRKDDDYLALEKRAEIANVAHADLFLSVHANYSDYPSARGVETYYTNTYSSVKARSREAGDGPSVENIDWTHVDIREKVRESHRFAASVQRSLYGALAAKTPGIANRGVKEAQYVVLTGTSMPAILAEVSFVSSPTDEGNLQSEIYREQIAEALYRGVARYAEESNRVKLASSAAKSSLR